MSNSTVNPMHSLTNQLSTTAANDNKQTNYFISNIFKFLLMNLQVFHKYKFSFLVNN